MLSLHFLFLELTTKVNIEIIRFFLSIDGWRVVDDEDYSQSVGNPKRKV
jgi:hypothetical protein